MGWLTVVLYAIGTWQSYRVATLPSARLRSSEGLLWWVFVYGLLALGINKQLDLQSALTEIGRMLATQYGWYEQRHLVQTFFIYCVAIFATSATIFMLYFARKAPLATIFALIGSIFLLAFVFIRAASFHHFDIFIHSAILGVKVNWIMEMGGISIIIASGVWRLNVD